MTRAVELGMQLGGLNTARYLYAATLLANGKVLVEGGATNTGGTLASAELFEPEIGAMTVQGHGTIDNQGNEVTFELRARQGEGDSRHNLFTFCDASAGVCITAGRVPDAPYIVGNSAKLIGYGHLEDGTRGRFRVSVTDNGAGTTDTISVTFDNGYTLSGNLTSGDIRIY